MRKLRDWIQNQINKWMEGRYGCDGLTLVLVLLSVLALCTAVSFHNKGLHILFHAVAYLLIGLALARALSKDTEKRTEELEAARKWADEVEYKLSLRKNTWEVRRMYRSIRCKKCGCRFRVQRGKGKVTVVCPSCRHRFNKRT